MYICNILGMIIGRRVSGLCGPHQRQAAKAIKRARLAGLLSFTSNWKIPESQLPDHVTQSDDIFTSSAREDKEDLIELSEMTRAKKRAAKLADARGEGTSASF